MTPDQMEDEEDGPFVSQEAEGDNWYFDMRGAVVGLDTRKPLQELESDLTHFRNYLEEKKREWVQESILKNGEKGLAAALYTDMKLIRAQLETCKSAIIGRRGRPSASSLDVEWPRYAFNCLKPEFLFQRQQQIDAAVLSQMRWKVRSAVLGANRKVVILYNDNTQEIHFYLRGYRTDGTYSDLPFTIRGNESAEVGTLQGWNGNWSTGERFEIWTYEHPVKSWGAEIE